MNESERKDWEGFLTGKYAQPGAQTRISSYPLGHLKPPVDDSSCVRPAAEFKLALRRPLEMMPTGERIRLLRAVLGWTSSGPPSNCESAGAHSFVTNRASTGVRRWGLLF
jgi:hypothetical protein